MLEGRDPEVEPCDDSQANALAAEGDSLLAAQLYPTITTDLDWVAANWQSQVR